MGESACLMQPFSYASGFNNEAKEGNHIHALGQSISFGRFTSESLAWEKWSTFSHNKYVEEAERYARPGSVAQKKAFFEAHYKQVAARKAAALLEQANAASNNVSESEFEGGVHDFTTQDSQMTTLNSQVAVDEQEVAKASNTEAGSIVDANRSSSNVEVHRFESSKFGGDDLVTEHKVLVANFVQVKSSSQLKNDDNKEDVEEMELSGTNQMENRMQFESSGQLGVVDNRKEVGEFKLSETTLMEKKPSISSTNSSTHGRSSKASKLPSSPAKPTARIRPKKEDSTTPISKKSAIDPTDKRRSTPKSVHKSINFTPAKELNRLTSKVIRKIDSSRVGSNSKASKDCSTPLRTPTTESMGGVPKHPFATPWSENRRARTPFDSASMNKTVRPKWHFLPTDCSKFLSPCRNKPQSPNSSTSFSLRTEERAARRKEKLEEKFNADKAQKVQLQATLKEKAETELRKLRQSLCFKARPLPDFYKERGTPKNQMKQIPLTQPQSPKLGRKPTASTAQSTTSQLPQRPSIKNIGSKHVLEKKNQSFTSRLIRITQENASPNIQQG